jgi:MFS family permease
MSSYLRVLRHRDFRYLFLGQAASVTGDRAVVVALALYVTQQTGSASDLSLVLAAQSLPLVALLLFGGVLADRAPRHRIIVGTNLIQGALHTLLAVLIFIGSVPVWQLMVIEALFGGVQAFFQPAFSGLLPQTVPEELIQDARALTETVQNLAILVGPALGTVLVLGLGAGEAFALDAASFFCSATLLLRVTPRVRGEASAPASVIADLRSGWQEVRSRTWVWLTIAVFTVAVMCAYAPWYALAPLITRDHYGSAGVFGLLETCAGLGAVVGAVTALHWRPAHPLRMGMLLVLAWPVQNLVLALGAPEPLLVVAGLATGIGFSLLGIWWETALAQHIPAGALSRVSAWDWMGSLGLLPVGFLIAGPLAAALGPRLVLGAGAVIGVTALVIALCSRSVRDLEPRPGGPEPSEVQPRRSRAMSV